MPSGLNATLDTMSGVPGQRGADRLAGDRIPQPHRVVRDCRRRSACPSGLNATLNTRSVCPVSGAPTGWPVTASHTRTVLSSPPEAIRRAVGAKRHAGHRAGVRRSAVRRRGRPVTASHSRTVLSTLPETIRAPSGLNLNPPMD